MVSKQWMQTPETRSKTDYIYYPIAYPSKTLTIMISASDIRYRDPWVISVDNTKFLDGVGGDYAAGDPDYIVFNILSIGF